MDFFELLHSGQEAGSQIVRGSVGWDDTDEYFFVGDDKENDGHTLVRVQLFEGRDHSKPLNPSRAQGHKMVCLLSSFCGSRIPPKDSLVYVAIPSGMEHVPGAGVIFAVIEKVPKKAGNVKADETVILGPGSSQGRVVIKENGTIAMVTAVGNAEGNGSVVFTISPDGFKFTSPYGSIVLDVTGFHVKTKDGPRIDMGKIAIPGLPGAIAGAITGYCNITAPVLNLKGNLTQIGVGSVYNPIVNCPTATATPAGLPTPAAGTPIPVAFGVRVAL